MQDGTHGEQRSNCGFFHDRLPPPKLFHHCNTGRKSNEGSGARRRNNRTSVSLVAHWKQRSNKDVIGHYQEALVLRLIQTFLFPPHNGKTSIP